MTKPAPAGQMKPLGGSVSLSNDEVGRAAVALVRVAAAVLQASGELRAIDAEWVELHLRLKPLRRGDPEDE